MNIFETFHFSYKKRKNIA